MPRNPDINAYYNPSFRRGSSAHRMIETGAGGKTGAEFIKMLVEDVDKLMRGEQAILLTGLLASAQISVNAMAGETLSQPTKAPLQPAPSIGNSALLRAARARKSYSMDDDDDDEES